jgi:hypothetical protein
MTKIIRKHFYHKQIYYELLVLGRENGFHPYMPMDIRLLLVSVLGSKWGSRQWDFARPTSVLEFLNNPWRLGTE